VPSTYECSGCGKPVIRPGRVKRRVFCSADCYHRSTIVHPDRECPGCGATFSPSESSRSGPRNGNPNRAYCSRECYDASRANTVTKTCPVCGSDFTVKACIAHRYRVCSIACKTADTIYVDCERCGRSFRAEKHLNRHYCSEECRRPPVYITCRNCNQTVRVVPFYAENGRQFCSFACYRGFVGETALEMRVRLALESLGVEFRQEYGIGKWSIDFALTGPQVAIEADGDYWHSVTAERDALRDAELERGGWRVVRLPERAVNSASDLGAYICKRVRDVTGIDLTAPSQASAPDGQLALWTYEEIAAALGHHAGTIAHRHLGCWGTSGTSLAV
jgi:very-short-patch-repair endonuclease